MVEKKRDIVLAQLSERKAHVCGIQEARPWQTGICATDEHVVCSSASDKKGGHGLMMAFSRAEPWGKGKIGKHCLGPNDISIVHATPMCLVVHVTSKYVSICAVAIHAPLETSADCKLQEFWNEHCMLIRKLAGGRPIIGLYDANSTTAQSLEGCIGSVIDGKKTAAGFEKFLQQTKSWVPVTYEQCGKGVVEKTYGHIQEG